MRLPGDLERITGDGGDQRAERWLPCQLPLNSEIFKTSLKSTKKSNDCRRAATVKGQPPLCYDRIKEEANCDAGGASR